MKHPALLLLPVLLLATTAVLAQSASDIVPPSAADIDRYKEAGAAAAAAARGQTGTFGPDGIVLGPDGKPVLKPNSPSATKDQLEFFQGVTGIIAVDNLADPSRGPAAATALTAQGHADFDCPRTGVANIERAIAGVSVRFTGCTVTGNAVSRVNLAVCPATLRGEFCNATNTTTQGFAQGWAPVDNVWVGVSCNTSRTCRVTVQSTGAVNTTATTLAAESQALATAQRAQGANSAVGALTQTYQSDKYRESYLSNGATLKACVDANNAALAAGRPPVTCDGQQEVGYTGGRRGTGNTCTESRSCVRTETRVVDYRTSCVRTLALTNYVRDYDIPTLTCTLVEDLKTLVTTSSCTEDQTAGGIKVDSTHDEAKCTLKETNLETGEETCVMQTWDEFHAFPQDITEIGEGYAVPYPVSGTCIWGTRPPVPQECNTWYRRTLSEAECSVDHDGLGAITQLTYKDKKGCGYCIAPQTRDLCYGETNERNPQDTCSGINLDPSMCRLTGTSVQSVETLLERQLVTSQQESYACSGTERSCAEWKYSSNCDADATLGLDRLQTSSVSSSGSFNQAIASAAVVDAIAQSAEANDNPMVPRVFGGEDMRCRKPVGFVGGALFNDCCKTSLERPGGNRPFHACNIDEVKLASIRRSHYEVYIGDYCSRKVRLAFVRLCVERKQVYCAFPGLLAKTIQKQGREQLANLTRSFGSRQTAGGSWSYYGNGSWGPQLSANGVTVVPWQWPAYCADPAKADNVLRSNPNAKDCPAALTLFVAVCDNPDGCGALPEAPGLGSERWLMQPVDPLTNITTAVSKYASITGACDPQSSTCIYDISAWPAGMGGRAVMTQTLDFPVWLVMEQTEATPTVVGAPRDMSNLGNYVFRPWSAQASSDLTTLPGTMRVDFSNNGAPWIPLQVPTVLSGDFAVPGTDLVINGRCDAAANLCSYQVTGTVAVTAKPWRKDGGGEEPNPDCTGFDLAQISALDFSKMDLSEWIATIMNKVPVPDAGALAGLAAQQAQDFYNVMQGGGNVSSTNPSRVQTAKVTPREEYGPFDATLSVAPNWPVQYEPGDPRNDDPILSVVVDWGDCTGTQTLAPQRVPVAGTMGQGFVATHRYAQPDQVACANLRAEKNIEHTVTLTVTAAKTGAHKLTMKVVNVWSNFHGTVGLNEGPAGNTGNTATAPAPGTGTPPVSPPTDSGPVNYCLAYSGVVTGDIPFGTGSLSSVSLGGFMGNGMFVGRFTVPAGFTSAAGATGLAHSIYVQGPSAVRTMSLSASPCDFRTPDLSGAAGPFGISSGLTPSIPFTVTGTKADTPQLVAGRTYYLNVVNQAMGQAAVTCAGVCDLALVVTAPQ